MHTTSCCPQNWKEKANRESQLIRSRSQSLKPVPVGTQAVDDGLPEAQCGWAWQSKTPGTRIRITGDFSSETTQAIRTFKVLKENPSTPPVYIH